MSKRIDLYRGDSIPRSVQQSSVRERGQTFARYFCGNGLIAKFSDGGSSYLLEGQGLLDLVLAHVGYELGKPEQKLADHSPLISFSECVDSSFRFSNRKQSVLEPCEFYEASHFIWRLDTTLDHELEPGRYTFKYQSDSVNCRGMVYEQLRRGHLSAAKGGPISDVAIPLMDAIAGVYADADQRQHYAEIIDVVTFVTAKNVSRYDQQLVRNTLERATRDHEWLVYPMDSMPDGPGYSGCLAMNKHLSVFRCFKMISKNRSGAP